MRYREQYTLIKRNLKSGKPVYYYRTYDENGNRTTAKSTGQSTKTAARTYCNELLKSGKLLNSTDITFADYSMDWWIYEKCPYIRSRIERKGSFSHTHADISRMNLEKHILPVFEKFKLNKISSDQIETWLLSFKEKGLSNTTANHNLATLQIMFNEAERLQYIQKNPVTEIKPLMMKPKDKNILTHLEVKTIFSISDMERVWGDPVLYTANLLGASTGMRLGEVIALQVENVFPEYVHVSQSYDRKYGIKDTKTHVSRNIPIPSLVAEHLKKLGMVIDSGFIFSRSNGNEPIYYRSITNSLYKALREIGISEEERKTRNITFHSWRHFFNTTLRASNVPDSKLQELTGHKTDSMTAHYTQFDIGDFKDVRRLQEQFFIE
jgi:integrase